MKTIILAILLKALSPMNRFVSLGRASELTIKDHTWHSEVKTFIESIVSNLDSS